MGKLIKKKRVIHSYLSEEDEGSENKLKKIKKQLKSCQKEKEEYLIQAQRARADLVNYRKRQEEALEGFKTYAKAGVIADLLPVLDSLDMAVEKSDNLQKIREQLINTLKRQGLEIIKTKEEKFDPQLHEAIEQVESNEKEGIIIGEVQRGYLLNGKVLRPSRVRVAK